MTKTWSPRLAKWVWLPGEEKPANAYVQFRKAFDIKKIPGSARVHVSADCRYLLFINGTVIGRGPIVTHPAYKQVDVYEVGCYLREGENVVGALVLQRHNKTSRLYPVRGGFILQCNSKQLVFGTDESWKARWAEEYKPDTPYMTHQYGQQEWVDGRKVPLGWESTGYDDSEWVNAVVIKGAQKFWPAEFEVRTVPHMLRKIVYPVKVVAYFGLSSGSIKRRNPGGEDYEPAKEIMVAYPMSSIRAWDIENIVHPENGSAILEETIGDGVGIVVDLGEEMLGYPFIEIECSAGATVNIGHGEILSRNRIQTVLMPESGAEQRYADRYITREGRQRFEVYDTKGCRYLEIHFNKLKDSRKKARVIIHKVGLVKSEPPFEMVSNFTCSDELLNRVWDICRRTAMVKCQDWHICDAQREQNQWPEFFQDMVYWQCFGRVEMVRQMIHTFCRLQLPSGFILSNFPPVVDKDINNITEKDLYIFSTLFFPLIICFDWLYGGEDERQPFWLECCRRIFTGLFKYIGPAGTLANLPGNQWLEWSGMDVRGYGRGAENSWEITAWNGIMILGLEKMAEMAEAYGKADWADCWREHAAAIRKAATDRFWEEERQAYIDGIYDGRKSSVVSQSTNAVAVLARMGDEERLRRAIAAAENLQLCDVPSAINMMALYHEALQSLCLDAPVLDRIRDVWGYMLEHGATTTWEAREALERNMGLCFGFGSHPLNYITRTVLGVTPLSPGYGRFSVWVVPSGLTHARGEIVTPRGFIKLSWEINPERFTLKILVPEGCEAVMAPPRLAGGKKTGNIILDGEQVNLALRGVAVCSFLRREMPSCLVKSGEHELVCFLQEGDKNGD